MYFKMLILVEFGYNKKKYEAELFSIIWIREGPVVGKELASWQELILYWYILEGVLI